MKHQRFLKSLTQQFTQWRRQYKVLRRKGKLLRSVSELNSQSRLGNIPKTLLKNIRLYVSTTSDGIQKPVIALRLITKSVQEHRLVNNIGVKWVHENRSSVILAIAIVSLTGVIGYKSYDQPKLKVDTVAPETIKAPTQPKLKTSKKPQSDAMLW